MQLRLHHRDLQLRSAFRLSRNSTTLRHSLIVELKLDGISGFGEVTDNAYYPMANIEVLKDAIQALEPVLAKADPDHPQVLHQALMASPLWPGQKLNPFALAALDMAAWDLASRRAGLPLYAFIGLDWQEELIPVSSYTLSVGEPEEVLAKARHFPWPQYKVKLGARQDLETLQLLRSELGPEVKLAVDANAGWSREEATEKIKAMQALDILFIEQALPARQWDDSRELRSSLKSLYPSVTPVLVADEDCQIEADVAACAEAYDVINIKLVKCGGITPALRMVKEAQALGLDLMFGCMVESSFGIGILRHLAPLAKYIDLDGHLLISNDPAAGIRFGADARPERPEGIGSGVSWR